jgi:hypothetical protein
MKMTHIAAACAVALAGAATPAFALTAFQTPDLTVYLSGATAPDNFLETTATNMYVGTKGTDWFKYIDNGDGKQQRAFFGTMKSTVDIPAALQGKKVLFIKRSTGGSVFGVNPVARAQALATLKVSAATCAASGVDFKCAVQGIDPGVGAPTGQEVVPDFGVSDVAPNLFKGPLNVEFGQSALDPAEVANLTVVGVNVLAMGLPVTNVIPMTTHISRATYGALLSANIATWSQLGIAAPAAGDQVVACRRVPGSGTQTSYNWFFNNFPCTDGSVAGSGYTQPARMSDSAGYQASGSGTDADPYVIDVTAGYTVIENSTSGNVRDCLDKAAAGGVHKFKDEEGKSYKVDFGTGGYGAVGTLSVDSLNDDRKTSSDSTKWAKGPTNAANGYSFRALDGAAAMYDTNDTATLVVGTTGTTGILPTKANLIDGNYEFASELTMQYRNDLTGLKKTFADFFIARSGDPAFNGSGWVAALPPTYTPGTTGFDVNVAKGTRFGNMCAPLQRLF